MQWLHNIRLMPKLIGSFVVIAVLAGAVGLFGLLGLEAMWGNLQTLSGSSVPTLVDLLRTQSAMSSAMRYNRGALLVSDHTLVVPYAGQATAARNQARQAYAAYLSLPFSGPQEATLAKSTQATLSTWATLDGQVGRLLGSDSVADRAHALSISLGEERTTSSLLTGQLNQLVAINQRDVQTQSSAGMNSYNTARTELVIMIVIGVLLSITLGLVIGRSIAGGVRAVQQMVTSMTDHCATYLENGLAALAIGDLTVQVTPVSEPITHYSRDEIGMTAEIANRMLAKLKATIAGYNTARLQLQGTISHVLEAATQMDSSTGQLAQTTEQIGQASVQIARAIEEVAHGASNQSRAAAEALQLMGSLQATASQVVTHTASQQDTVRQTEQAVNTLNAALQATTGQVEAVTSAATRAAATARDGGAAVTQTIASVEEVRAAVLKSAELVAALPIQVGGTVIGALALYAGEADAFDDEEQHLLERLAGDLSYGITTRRADAARTEVHHQLRSVEERFRSIFEQNSVGMARVAPDGRYLQVNDRLCTLLGYSRQELLQLRFADVTDPDDLVEDEEALRDANRRQLPSIFREKRYIRKEGSHLWAAVTVAFIRDEAGVLLYWITVVEDITARKQAQEEHALLANVVETTPIGVVITDPTLPDNPIVYVNPAYIAITGYAAQEALGRNPRFVQGPATDPATRQKLHQAVAQIRPAVATVLNYRKDGTPIWNEVRITPIVDDQGRVRHWVGLKIDVTDRIRMEEELRRLALYDTLTGLSNRTLLLDRLEQVLAAHEGGEAALLVLGLDHFQEVNDTFGHTLGDGLLRLVAERLSTAIGAPCLVARLGNDEFAVLAPGADAEEAQQIARVIQDALHAPCVVEGVRVRVQVSLGIALAPAHGRDGPALLRHADVVLDQAKRSRCGMRIYAPETDGHTPDRLAWVEEVRAAVEDQRLSLYYQPIVAAADEHLLAVEALVRWEHPERGVVAPGALLPVVERLGLQATLTQWVVHTALAQQRAWRAGGLQGFHYAPPLPPDHVPAWSRAMGPPHSR